MNRVLIRIGILIFGIAYSQAGRGWGETMMEQVLHSRNLEKAYRKVVSNRGSSGVELMTTHELKPYLGKHQSQIVETILQREYVPSPILGEEIPKSS